MNIGDKVVIVSVAPYNSFTGHNVKTQPIFRTIEVLEERESKPYRDGDAPKKGYLAKDNQDGTFFAYNYPNEHIGFSGCPWTKWMDDGEFTKLSEDEKSAFVEDYIYTDVTQYQVPAMLQVAGVDSVLGHCDTHQRHYYLTDGCFYCTHDLDRPKIIMNLEEHKFFGWYK